MEPDESLRLRTWLRMQAWGLGSCYGVEYHARTVGLGAVGDARCYDPPYTELGRMRLVVLPSASFTGDFAPVLARIGAHVMARHRRPGAVWIDTVPARVRRVDVGGPLFLRRGASQVGVIATAGAAVAAYMAGRRRIGALLSHARLDAAVCTADVVNARLTPETDLRMGPEEAAELGALALTAAVADD